MSHELWFENGLWNENVNEMNFTVKISLDSGNGINNYHHLSTNIEIVIKFQICWNYKKKSSLLWLTGVHEKSQSFDLLIYLHRCNLKWNVLAEWMYVCDFFVKLINKIIAACSIKLIAFNSIFVLFIKTISLFSSCLCHCLLRFALIYFLLFCLI